MPTVKGRPRGPPDSTWPTHVIGIVGPHNGSSGGIGGEQLPGLLGNGGEHLVWGRGPSHQDRHPAQRRLLVSGSVPAGSFW